MALAPGPGLPPPVFTVSARIDAVLVEISSFPPTANVTPTAVETGIVKSVGPGTPDFFGATSDPTNISISTNDLALNAKVIFPTGTGEKFSIAGVEHRLIRDDQILAVWAFV